MRTDSFSTCLCTNQLGVQTKKTRMIAKAASTHITCGILEDPRRFLNTRLKIAKFFKKALDGISVQKVSNAQNVTQQSNDYITLTNISVLIVTNYGVTSQRSAPFSILLKKRILQTNFAKTIEKQLLDNQSPT